MFLTSKKSTDFWFFFAYFLNLGELYKTDVQKVTIINHADLHKKTVDNVYNFVYKSFFIEFLLFCMWMTMYL